MINQTFEDIKVLLDKYWECQTNIEEENILHQFFTSENNIPEDLLKYKSIFDYKEQEKSQKVSDNFLVSLNNKLENVKKEEKKYITVRIFLPAIRVAASLLLIFGIGFGIYNVATSTKPIFAETYNDPNAAIDDATFALDKLSEALNRGEEASKENLKMIDSMDIDWEALDSIASSETAKSNLNKDINNKDS